MIICTENDEKFNIYKDRINNRKVIFTIKQIFKDNWNKFFSDNPNIKIRDIVYYNVNRMLKCKTTDLGFSYSSLISVRIPNSVKEIDYYLFYGCSNLKEIYFPSGVTILDQEGIFGNFSQGKIADGSIIYVPDEDTKNSLNEGTCTTCSYNSEWTTIIVDPTKFN